MILEALREASLAPLPAFPIELIAFMTASSTSFGLCMVVAALSMYIIRTYVLSYFKAYTYT